MPEVQCKEVTSKDKWIISLMAGLLFIIVSSPIVVDFVNRVIGCKYSCYTSIFVLGFIYMLLTRMLM